MKVFHSISWIPRVVYWPPACLMWGIFSCCAISSRHSFWITPKWRSSLFYSTARYDNDVLLTGTGITESLDSWHAALIYSPFPKLDVGAEYMVGNRELESGADGELQRLQMHVKYNF